MRWMRSWVLLHLRMLCSAVGWRILLSPQVPTPRALPDVPSFLLPDAVISTVLTLRRPHLSCRFARPPLSARCSFPPPRFAYHPPSPPHPRPLGIITTLRPVSPTHSCPLEYNPLPRFARRSNGCGVTPTPRPHFAHHPNPLCKLSVACSDSGFGLLLESVMLIPSAKSLRYLLHTLSTVEIMFSIWLWPPPAEDRSFTAGHVQLFHRWRGHTSCGVIPTAY